MNTTSLTLAVLLALGSAAFAQSASSACTERDADALAFLTAPPTVFAPEVISTAAEEYSLSFTPDGKSVYFSRSKDFFPISRQASILVSHWDGQRWSAPQTALFSGKYTDLDPFVTPDGQRLYFSSIRPVNGQARQDLDLWMVERRGSGWSEPVHLGAAVNSEVDELYPSVSRDGTLYFGSFRSGGVDLYRSVLTGQGRHAQAEPLPNTVNTAAWEYNPAISPDGNTLVFTSLNRPGGQGLGDLYLSCHAGNSWSQAVNLGEPINTAADDYHPSFSPDRRSLFFIRRLDQGDVYQVPWRWR